MPEPSACINHPNVATRLSCTSCDRPICVRCAQSAAVGQKCPDCARMPRRARGRGKPIHYVRAVASGLASAIAAGVVFVQLLATLRFGGLILAGVAGWAVGRAVSWGAQKQAQPPFPAIAAACAVAGLAVGLAVFTGDPFPRSPYLWLAYPVAGWLAHRSVGS